MDSAVEPVLAHLDRHDPGGIVGVYLYGSATVTGLRPDSDIDLLVLTRRSLGVRERAALVDTLLAASGWQGHAATFPEAAARRPLELTVLVVGDTRPWQVTPRHDFQYGEWLRADLVAGRIPQPADDPDVPILVATAQSSHRVLRGAELGDVLAPVDRDILHAALRAVVPDILEEIVGDERNTLLVLARILVTLDSGRIVSKDAAADAIAALSPRRTANCSNVPVTATSASAPTTGAG
ncbi:aminoglycoside adenylyltransferase domain-containing protein [Prescottella sp. R16]|uniref:aminoglycoside adenylyltransferase domain-containing protein n=1 Tax=Prescottella sp. R16 TaxID=3064529 RepID=UPI00272EA152|nr:aminoglycoside adenylyltransferase domain-containing protein [Prescottella sp. R16]